jgi:glutamate formiminotransferase
MRILTIPNWSFGRNKLLLRKFEEILLAHEVMVHFLESDIDHNRTVSAFSGEPEALMEAIDAMAGEAFECVDLNHHIGVHPRIGALDVCPFVPLVSRFEDRADVNQAALALAERVGAMLGSKYEVPVFLYEDSARGGRESTLPALRKGGFGGLLEKVLHPDFGPAYAHPRLGVTVVGVRDFLIALNLNLAQELPYVAQGLAKRIRDLRAAGDERFLGVRALGFALASKGISQVSLSLTLPDLSPIDPIVKWVQDQAYAQSVGFAGVELIGVIRRKDLEHATTVYPRREQIIDED